MSYRDWLTVWYSPQEDDIIAYISVERIAEIGGVNLADYPHGVNANQINQGMAVLQRWCRINCTIPPRPVNVMGKTGFAFTNNADALVFKLTWG